jgi:transposase
MTVVLLRFKCRASLNNVATVLSVFGVSLSKSAVSNILTQAKHHLKDKYNDLIQAVRDGKIIYNDETGWMIRGERAWMWVMANKDITIYHASESRGKGNAEELYGTSNAYSMHDGYAGYTNTIPKDKHLFCWAHILRYAYEETHKLPDTHPAVLFRKKLVVCYHLKERRKGQELAQALSNKLDTLIKQTTTDDTIRNMQGRLRTQRNGLIRALLLTPDGTNNLSERDLRGMAIARRISFGSDTLGGMQTTAVIGSVVQTIGKQQEQDQFLSMLKTYLHQGVQKTYLQYSHASYYDTS